MALALSFSCVSQERISVFRSGCELLTSSLDHPGGAHRVEQLLSFRGGEITWCSAGQQGQ